MYGYLRKVVLRTRGYFRLCTHMYNITVITVNGRNFRFADRDPRRILQVQSGPFIHVAGRPVIRKFSPSSGVSDGEKVQHATG